MSLAHRYHLLVSRPIRSLPAAIPLTQVTQTVATDVDGREKENSDIDKPTRYKEKERVNIVGEEPLLGVTITGGNLA